MPKVGIMAEVSEEVFNEVIVPAKARKGFNKLVGNLLEAYYQSDKVRSIVDGIAEMNYLEGLSSLQEQLHQANQSLDYMGMLGDSMQMSLDEAKQDISTPVSRGRDSEFEDFKREMQNSQNQFMADIKAMLSSIGGTASSVTVEEPKPKPSPVTQAPISDFSDDGFSDGFDIEVEESNDVSSGTETSGDALLSQLLGSSNSVSFGG